MTPDVRGCRGFVAAIFASLSLSALVALPASAQNEIAIGAPLPLTGALSPEGEKLRAGYELWLQELDRTGGVNVGGVKHKVKLIYSDYQSTTPRAVQLMEKLDGLLQRGLRSELQEPVRPLHAERDPERANLRAGQGQVSGRQTRGDPRPQRFISARARQ